MNVERFRAVEIEINNACNRRCSYCPNSLTKPKKNDEIDPRLYEKLMRELGGIRYDGRVSFSFYNEPLLHPDFEGIVSRTRHHLPKASLVVYTNGTLLGRARLERLLDLGVNEFIVTRHEREQEGEYEFEGVYGNLDDERRRRVRYRSHRDLKLTNRGGLLKHLGAEGLPLAPCHIPSMIVTVMSSGNVLPCFEDYEERLVMGNLRDQTLMEIWESDRFARFRKDLRRGLRHAHGPCRNCNRRESLASASP